MSTDIDRWYTVAEIVDALGVHEETVRRWLRDGELRGTALGRRSGYRVRKADLDAFMQRHAPERIPYPPAGRELDELIAQRVLGETFDPESTPHYSTNMDAAWSVFRRAQDIVRWGFIELEDLPDGGASIRMVQDQSLPYGLRRRENRLEADTRPLAICYAALWALDDARI